MCNNESLMIGRVYSGEEFKKRCNRVLYRITNPKENHRGFQYKTGLNIDTLRFNPDGECNPGGLYFFDQTQLKQYIY